MKNVPSTRRSALPTLRRRIGVGLGLLSGVISAATIAHSSAASAAERELYDAGWSAPSAARRGDVFGIAPGVVQSREASRGVPSLFVSAPTEPVQASSAEEAARHHLRNIRGTYGVSAAVIDEARPLFTHDIGRGGIIAVLRQTVGGVDVFHGDVKVMLDRDFRLVAVAGSPHPGARADAALDFDLGPEDATASALSDLYGADVLAAQLSRRAGRADLPGETFLDFAADAGPTAVHMRAPARVKPVYFPIGDGLIPAFFVETQTYVGADPELDGYQYVVAADDGRVLYRRSMKASEAVSYRVWADADGDHRPADGPFADHTPHPTGFPDVGPTEFVKPNLITIEAFNTNPDGGSDPWLPEGAVETLGNNVDAYVDHTSPSGFHPEEGEFRAAITAPATFDHNYNTDLEPLASQEQSMAATTQLFYDINWLHDYWYDSGFNEAAGNAQEDNFGRGGADGDRLQAQAQDAALTGARNNANMMTPSDGISPVMQMYLWTPRNSSASLTLAPSESSFTVTKGQFGPTKYELSGALVLVDDGEGVSPTDGCEPPKNDVDGKIVLIDRGDCTFETKVNGALSKGAIAVVIADNVDGNSPPGLGNDGDMEDPTIPTQAVTKADGAQIKAELEGGTVTATMVGDSDAERDGTIDNQIVAHEWGHYIHHRLVECGSSQCGAMSEGWGDFLALHQALREGDDLDATYASQTYAGFDPAGYFGIRRVPYSVDMEKDPLTFKHIGTDNSLPQIEAINIGGSNAQVHNAGEVWATMMWEVYIGLHKANPDKSFAEVRRSLSDYVVAGMIMTPPAPTYTEQRDAILIAISQMDEDDFITAAEAFARRGAGTCAVGPERESKDFTGIIESYDLRANAALTSLDVGEGDDSCDGDGVIDGGESGTISIELFNNGVEELPAGAKVEIISPTPSLTFPEGNQVTLPAVPRLDKYDLSLPVAATAGLTDDEHVNLTVRLTTPGGCAEVRDLKLPIVLHGDIYPESSAIDDVEVPDSPWGINGAAGDTVWHRLPTEESGYVWNGRDIGNVSDTSLISPPLQALAGQSLVITFDHAYQFEFSDDTAWDGGVLEVSSDQGESWEDVSNYLDPGYNGTIDSVANPINGVEAFTDESPGYPKMQPMTLDFGEAFAGKSVLLRFRIGTDSAAGAEGWSIDNIAVSGISNTPFPTWIPDNCGMGPTTDSSSETGGLETETGVDTDDDSATSSTGGGIDGETGCGCTVESADPAQREKAASLALWLGLAGLVRGRRRRRRQA